MNKTIMFLMAFLVMSMAFTSAVPYTNAKAIGTKTHLATPSSEVTPKHSSESGGIPLSMLSKYGWDGEKCVLRPIVSPPVLVRTDRKESKGVFWVKYSDYKNSTLFEYRVYLLRAIAGYNPETHRFTFNKECDKSIMDGAEPMPMFWWRQNLTA